MPYGPIKVYTASFATNGTLSSEIKLDKSHRQLLLEVPSGTGYGMGILGANSSGGDYKDLYFNVSSGVAEPDPVLINTSGIAGDGAFVGIPLFTDYIKFESGTQVANGQTIRIYGID